MAQFCALFSLLGGLGACDSVDDTGPAAPVAAATTANPGASYLPDSTPFAACADGGELSTRLYGALEGAVEWAASEMQCQGMPRPNDAGARLRFSGQVDGGAEIAFIIAIPSLEEGHLANELASNVTVIEERSSRFFSTANLDSCWTDVNTQSPVAGQERVFSISGVLYCITPLPEVNGDGSVSIEELRFAGMLDWAAK